MGEEPVALAAGGLPYTNDMSGTDLGGDGYLAVATTKGYVRFFSGAGVQRYVWTVGGDVVTMAAGAEWTFVVHREGGTSLDGERGMSPLVPLSLKNYSRMSEPPILPDYVPILRYHPSWIPADTSGSYISLDRHHDGRRASLRQCD